MVKLHFLGVSLGCVSYVLKLLMLSAAEIVAAVRESVRAQERISRPCGSHGKLDKDGNSESLRGHPGTRFGYLIGDLPRMLQVYLNVSGRKGQKKKKYNVQSVPESVTPAALGHVDATRLDHYELVCIWCHTGGTTFKSGHWFSYVKTHGLWYKVDKTSVTRTEFREIKFRFVVVHGYEFGCMRTSFVWCVCSERSTTTVASTLIYERITAE
jgi:hypothetical protein